MTGSVLVWVDLNNQHIQVNVEYTFDENELDALDVYIEDTDFEVFDLLNEKWQRIVELACYADRNDDMLVGV